MTQQASGIGDRMSEPAEGQARSARRRAIEGGRRGDVDPGTAVQGGRERPVLRRRPWENASAVVIGLGILMQVQPFALELYTWSFTVILAGTLGFLVTSHFPE
jgi:hypothetical protein